MSEHRSDFEPHVRDCLVGVVAADSDLKRFRDEGWYRIPDRALGRSLGRDAFENLRALAIYQTSGVTDGLQGAIELWGEIAEIESLPRRDLLPDEPNHPAANELYHRLRVNSVRQLEQPIVSRLPRRITFLRTTRQRLLIASELNDLIIGSAAEERLWQAVREQRLQFDRKVFLQIDGVLMEVDFGMVIEDRGLGILCCDDEHIADGMVGHVPQAWRVIRFSPGRIELELDACMNEIIRAAETMGNEVRRVK